MADKTGISWTQATWNPTAGCSIVSPGCASCYAMGEAHRFGHNPALGGKYAGLTTLVKGKAVWNGVVRLHEAALDQPIRWKRPRRIFVNSMSDVFHESLSYGDIDRTFAVMALAQQHTFQVLTKRSSNMREYMNHSLVALRIEREMRDIVDARKMKPIPECFRLKLPLPNVWLGVSAERQTEADERVPDLLSTPAAVRWVSAEPLLGPIVFASWLSRNGLFRPYDPGYSDPMPGLDWIVAGGESSKDRQEARPMHPNWARHIRDQCKAAGVAFFFKQWGENAPLDKTPSIAEMADAEVDEFFVFHPPGSPPVFMKTFGKKIAGDLLDGVEHKEYPA